MRLGKAGVRFAYLEEKLAVHKLYVDNKTLGARVKVHKEINDMFKKQFGKVPDCWLFNYAHVVVEEHPHKDDNAKMVAMRVGVYSLLSALRWNWRISKTMRKTVYS